MPLQYILRVVIRVLSGALRTFASGSSWIQHSLNPFSQSVSATIQYTLRIWPIHFTLLSEYRMQWTTSFVHRRRTLQFHYCWCRSLLCFETGDSSCSISPLYCCKERWILRDNLKHLQWHHQLASLFFCPLCFWFPLHTLSCCFCYYPWKLDNIIMIYSSIGLYSTPNHSLSVSSTSALISGVILSLIFL